MSRSHWREIPLEDIVESFIDFRGRTPKKLSMNWGGGDIPALSANNVQMGKINLEKGTQYGSEALYQRWMTSGDCAKGDIVMTMEAPLGNVAQIPDNQKYILSQRVILLKTRRHLVDNDFLFQRLSWKHFQATLKEHATGTTAQGIQRAKLEKIPLTLPTVLEQRSIAAVLSWLDRAIEQTEALIAKQQRIKAGLMQDLLTKGIDHHGNIRFEENHEFKDSPLGRIPNEWGLEPLLQSVPIADYGISVSLDDENGIPVLRMNNLKSGEIDLADLKFSASNEAKKLLLRPFDVLFNRTNSIEHVGRTSIWRGQIEKASFASYLVRLLPNLNKLLPEYLNYWCNLESTQIAMRVYATIGVHQVNINPTNLRKLLFSFPTDLEEQRRIVDMIDQQTRAIHIEGRNLEKLKAVKQGLMQDLFTGEVSVDSLLAGPTTLSA